MHYSKNFAWMLTGSDVIIYFRYDGNTKMIFQTAKVVENHLLTTLLAKENITAVIVEEYFALIVSLSLFPEAPKDAPLEFVM